MNGDLFGDAGPLWRTALVDFPWPEKGGGKIKRGADRWYPTVGKSGAPTIPEGARLIRSSGLWRPHENAHLWFWTTDNYLPAGLSMIGELGFVYKRAFVWAKTRDEDGDLDEDDDLAFGIGKYARGAHELLLFATRGKGMDASVWTGARNIRSLFGAPHPRDESGKRIHSRKPTKSHVLIERVSRGPRCEFFARTERVAEDGERWSSWGFDAPVVETTPPAAR